MLPPRALPRLRGSSAAFDVADVAVLVSPEPTLRELALPTLASHGWRPVPFRNPGTAFHYACGNASRLGAALVDEDVGSLAAKVLLRRLEILARGRVLRTVVLPGSDRVGRIRLRATDHDAHRRRMGELVWALVRVRLGRPAAPAR